MGNGASRILNIMKNSGKNTISVKSFVTVTSLEPLTFKLEDKLTLTSEFYVLSDDIIKERLVIGQKFLAFSFNDGQCYFIHQSVDNSIVKSKIVDNLQDSSKIDSLSANQGKLLGDRVLSLETEVTNIKTRLLQAENDILDLKSRVSTLENR